MNHLQISRESKNDLPSQASLRSYEVSRKKVLRQNLKRDEKIRYFLLDYIAYLMAVVLIITLLYPALAFPLSTVFIAMYCMSLSTRKFTQWALCPPIYLTSPETLMKIPTVVENKGEKSKKMKEPNKKNKEKSLGLIYLGNDTDRGGKAVWFSRRELNTHMVIFGKTGSGKTELLLGMMYQFIVLGSGFIYVDGKGGVSSWTKLYSIAKQLGLEDNILLLNFFTGDKSNNQNTVGEKISNTFNPFAEGSSETLMEMLSSMMGDTGGENAMWRGRAEALGRCLLRALCEFRDKGKIELSVETIREYMSLDKIEELSLHSELLDSTKNSICYYLNDLPGWKIYKESSSQKEKMQAALEVNKHHGFLTMQYTHVLELLSGTYGHIMKTDLSEVDFYDVIVNRRILYVMLPSLQKSPESLKHLGSMIVSSLRNALSKLLGGDHLTGSKEQLLHNKAFSANVPFGLFLDEYGSYCVEGFADMAAQARELNVTLCFAGQDYASFRQGSQIEAERINANTGIKIFMQTDCKETKELAIVRAGQAYAYLSENMKSRSPNNQNTADARLQLIDRITFEQLFSQKPGECHVIYGDKLWRVKSFYGDFELSEKYQLNQFIKLRFPSSHPQYANKMSVQKIEDTVIFEKEKKHGVDEESSELKLSIQ